MARRSGLGRGLGSLIPTEPIGRPGSRSKRCRSHRYDRTLYSPEVISMRRRCRLLRPRSAEVGLLQPILVRDLGEGEFEIVAGERRWRAARRAGLQTIPVIIQTVSDSSSLEHALVENLHRADLNALEEAAAFHQLIDDFGYTHEQVATRWGEAEPP